MWRELSIEFPNSPYKSSLTKRFSSQIGHTIKKAPPEQIRRGFFVLYFHFSIGMLCCVGGYLEDAFLDFHALKHGAFVP